MGEATVIATEWTTLAAGLRFPEGPVAMDDGSVLVVEIARGTLSRVTPDGAVEALAECGDGPNGAAIGPDGAIWITDNGGCFTYVDLGGVLIPGPVPPEWTGGSIQKVDLATGSVETIYTECDGRPLRAPNDLVFDAHGGFWFTDHGVRLQRTSDRTGVFYATADGESIRGVQCGEILRVLMERDFLRIVGRSEELGRPFLYGTTRKFLQVFGLRRLEQLPPVDQICNAASRAAESLELRGASE